jgi:phosphate transport system substrate-binding protein
LKIWNKMKKDVKAVSPIVAVLMLVLVSVGAATAFYVWETGWQADITDKTGGTDVQASITIAGSTTVYEFTKVAAELFEAETGVKVAYQGGGSGAGVQSVGTGVVDIGSASRAVKSSELAQYPDLNGDNAKDYGKELVSSVIGYDGVVVIANDDHALTDINETALRAVFYANGGVAKASWDSEVTQWMTWFDANTDDLVQWDELISGDSSNATITLYDRAEHSGTEETFCGKMLDIDADTLEDGGITVTHETGNQALLAAVEADEDALAFCAFGIVAASDDVNVPTFETVEATADSIKDGSYAGSRPLVYVTVGEPTGDIAQYINFCLSPENNDFINDEADYVSLYA